MADDIGPRDTSCEWIGSFMDDKFHIFVLYPVLRLADPSAMTCRDVVTPRANPLFGFIPGANSFIVKFFMPNSSPPPLPIVNFQYFVLLQIHILAVAPSYSPSVARHYLSGWRILVCLFL